jgi:HSP20 family molecular chaperone IbpA
MITQKKQKKIKQSGKTPPTEISRNPQSINIRCLLNGIPEEKIRIDLEHNRLTISAANDDEVILKKIKVPSGSYISSKKFHEGVLEILLER